MRILGGLVYLKKKNFNHNFKKSCKLTANSNIRGIKKTDRHYMCENIRQNKKYRLFFIITIIYKFKLSNSNPYYSNS